MNPFEQFKDDVRKRISKAVKVKEEDVVLEKPPQTEFGDIAFPSFTLSKKLRKSPDAIAKDMAYSKGRAERRLSEFLC